MKIESVEKYIRENPPKPLKEFSSEVSTMDYNDYIADLADNL